MKHPLVRIRGATDVGACVALPIDRRIATGNMTLATVCAAMPRPMLVIDDASHQAAHVLAVLRFIDKALIAGDYLIVEDGVLTHLGWDKDYDGGPLAALKTFLEEAGHRYEIDRARCDAYGRNVTWNPEGYLKRIA